jgi:hypothetical protein
MPKALGGMAPTNECRRGTAVALELIQGTELNVRGQSMTDLVFVAAIIAFFAVCILYTYACGRL